VRKFAWRKVSTRPKPNPAAVKASTRLRSAHARSKTADRTPPPEANPGSMPLSSAVLRTKAATGATNTNSESAERTWQKATARTAVWLSVK
jgi:hypothetical protein